MTTLQACEHQVEPPDRRNSGAQRRLESDWIIAVIPLAKDEGSVDQNLNNVCCLLIIMMMIKAEALIRGGLVFCFFLFM